jgi:ribosomal protein S18 acetylase RimI-like enzyme
VAVTIRQAHSSDYGRVIQHVDAWWGGREVASLLPRLFFIHFEGTSFVADREDGSLAGFLIGFLSQTEPETAYVHFIGVAPAERGSGLGRELYERFFAAARRHGRTLVRCVTSPENTASLAFHEALGFSVEETIEDYDGRGESRVVLARQLG